MTDIPVIMSGPMVRALLEDRKTMTRRLAWRPEKSVPERDRAKLERLGHVFTRRDGDCFSSAPSPWQKVKPGDRLWVRENFRHWRGSASGKTAVYAADDVWLDHGSGETCVDKVQWLTPMTPSIHMPRWASRLTLIVTGTKIERLQDISEKDCEAEGCCVDSADGLDVWYIPGSGMLPHKASGRGCFQWLWESLHGHDAWQANPEVVAVSFRVIKANIDSELAKAA